MPSAVASAALRPAVSERPGFALVRGFALVGVQGLRLRLKQRQQRRLDRAVAETVLALDHPGLTEDYRAACRRW